MKIAVDAFGGDLAPQSTLTGVSLALAQEKGLEITLVGRKADLVDALPDDLPTGIALLDVPGSIQTADGNPNVAGENPDSAIRTALRLHHQGRFDAVVSAGPTGAQVLASLQELDKCFGITRPAVGSILPTAKGRTYLIDVGASLVASPHHLVQFAAMGHVYAREVFGVPEPRIGLLNIGHERLVGERAVVEAHRLLSDSGFNFVGFMEGRDIPAGCADVVVTNGLIGNVLLKFAEGLPVAMKQFLPPDTKPHIWESLASGFDYEAFGGEPLLGVKGVSIICHGASTDRAIAAAIRQAGQMVELKLHERLEAFLVGKFASYFSQVKYLRSFRRSPRWSTRLRGKDRGESND